MDLLYLAACLCSLLILTEEGEVGLPGRQVGAHTWVQACGTGWIKGTKMGCLPFCPQKEGKWLLLLDVAVELRLR